MGKKVHTKVEGVRGCDKVSETNCIWVTREAVLQLEHSVYIRKEVIWPKCPISQPASINVTYQSHSDQES